MAAPGAEGFTRLGARLAESTVYRDRAGCDTAGPAPQRPDFHHTADSESKVHLMEAHLSVGGLVVKGEGSPHSCVPGAKRQVRPLSRGSGLAGPHLRLTEGGEGWLQWRLVLRICPAALKRLFQVCLRRRELSWGSLRSRSKHFPECLSGGTSGCLSSLTCKISWPGEMRKLEKD